MIDPAPGSDRARIVVDCDDPGSWAEKPGGSAATADSVSDL